MPARPLPIIKIVSKQSSSDEQLDRFYDMPVKLPVLRLLTIYFFVSEHLHPIIPVSYPNQLDTLPHQMGIACK